MKISELSMSILIHAYCNANDVELTESEVVAVCSALDVRYGNSGVKTALDISEEGKSDIREYSTDLALLIEISKDDDIDDQLLKDAAMKFNEFQNAMSGLRERFSAELAETKAKVYSEINKVIRVRTENVI